MAAKWQPQHATASFASRKTLEPVGQLYNSLLMSKNCSFLPEMEGKLYRFSSAYEHKPSICEFLEVFDDTDRVGKWLSLDLLPTDPLISHPV